MSPSIYTYYVSIRFYNTALPKKAVGEIIPVLFATTIAIPVSMYGTVKSTTASRSELIIKDVSTISVLRFTRSAMRPFHLPFYNKFDYFKVYIINIVVICKILIMNIANGAKSLNKYVMLLDVIKSDL